MGRVGTRYYICHDERKDVRLIFHVNHDQNVIHDVTVNVFNQYILYIFIENLVMAAA